MHGIYIFQAFWRQSSTQVFFTDTVYAMSCHFFSALIDEQPVSIRRLGFFPVFIDIVFNQDSCFRHQLHLAIAVCLAQYGQSFFFAVEVVKVQCSDLAGPGSRVIKQQQKAVIAEALFFVLNLRLGWS